MNRIERRTAAVMLGAFLATTCTNGAERPNIVLIFSDDQGVNDVGCYGSEIPTPHIDSIGRNGVRFDQWYSASSICTPSRYGLLTGRNPCRSQDQLLSALMFLSDDHASRGLQQGETTIGTVLSDAGYRTALIGKWHLGHGDRKFLPVQHGFDLFKGHTGGCIDYFTMTYGVTNDWYEGTSTVPKNGYATELITDEAVKYLQDAAATSDQQQQPFFLYLPYNAPHFGKGWNPSKNETVNIMQAQGHDLQRVANIEDKIRREFAAMVVSLDDGVGRILSTLTELGLADNTLVIFLTDHGGDPVYGGSNKPLRGNKATLFEGGLRVPCLMQWPAGIRQPGRVVPGVFSSLDLFPTFCDLAQSKPSETIDGQSILPYLNSDRSPPDRELVWRTGTHAELNRGNWVALRSGDWKYVQDDDGQEFLFNLKTDPHEQTNLQASEPQRFNQLRKKATARIAELTP